MWRVRRRLSRVVAWIGLGCAVGPIAIEIVLAGITQLFSLSDRLAVAGLGVWVAAWLAGVPIAGVVSFIAGMRRRQKITALEVEGGSLRIVRSGGGEQRIAREAIDSALIVPKEIKPNEPDAEVEVSLSSGDVLHVRFREGGPEQDLVDALGFAPSQRRVVIPLGDARDPLSAGCGAALLGMMATGVTMCGTYVVAAATHASDRTVVHVLPYVLGAVFVGSTLLIARLAMPNRLVIGADGVLLEGPFWKRFFPRASIVRVEQVKQDLALMVQRGDTVEQVNLTAESSSRRQDALVRRIRDALALPAQGAEDARAAMLAKGEEPIARWRERLRRVVSAGRGYRAESIPTDALVRTAADAGAAADLRVGAAMAIALTDDADAKRELRFATEAIANEKLRVAMESAAEGTADEEAIAIALAEDARARKA